uniref:Uncharacterized protein n=1 Tax=Nomascus leucogenys TaxID=61853 RepID=A0A2I3HPN6_NOMLE
FVLQEKTLDLLRHSLDIRELLWISTVWKAFCANSVLLNISKFILDKSVIYIHGYSKVLKCCDSLIKHQRTCTGEKPYWSEEDSKRFIVVQLWSPTRESTLESSTMMNIVCEGRPLFGS